MPQPLRPRRSASQDHARGPQAAEENCLRIIGGTLRHRKVRYSGHPRTRPMKERLREAVFNVLADDVKGKHVLDLFAGTGALGFEALSRGAHRATFLEQHFPTARIVRENAVALEVETQIECLAANTLVQFRRRPPLDLDEPDRPWLAFCSPPYAMYLERASDMRRLIETLQTLSPPGSIVVVEFDERYDATQLPDPEAWRIRDYPPARIAIWYKPAEAPSTDG